MSMASCCVSFLLLPVHAFCPSAGQSSLPHVPALHSTAHQRLLHAFLLPPCRRVDVMTPAGKMLARQLNFEVQPGHSLLVTGPNGSGKTSVFRWAGCCVRAA